MGAILQLIKFLMANLPAIMALISALFGGGAAVSYHASWNQIKTEAASQPGVSAPDDALWYEYVCGSAGAGAAGALVLGSANGMQRKAYAALEAKEAIEAELGKLGIERFEVENRARMLRAQLDALPGGKC